MRRRHYITHTRWLLSVALLGLSVGMAVAFFSARAWLQGRVLGTATTAITISQVAPEVFSPFVPGVLQPFSWLITNEGTVALNLASRFVGEWSKAGLDSMAISLRNLEYRLSGGGDWHTVSDAIIHSGEQFFVGQSEQQLETIEAGQSVEVRGAVALDAAVDNQYQSSEFPFELQIIGKQTTEGAAWPTYE